MKDVSQTRATVDPDGEGVSAYLSGSFVTVGGRTYPMKTLKRCHVCKSYFRLAIEMSVVLGVNYTATARIFGAVGISSNSVWRHFVNGHVPGFGASQESS